MQDFQPRERGRSPSRDAAGVTHFASQVVSYLADRTARSILEPREPLVTGLISASLSGARADFAGLLAELRRSRIGLAALADIYIPEAARRMGASWHEDKLSWMEVTIGVARLQSLLREISSAWSADQAVDKGRGTVMLLVPEGEQHTLGPMVALSQLRRLGVSVCLRMGPSPSDLQALLAERQFDGILLSISTKERLAAAESSVKLLKGAVDKTCPIVVGGAVMSKVGDPASCIGADLSSNDIGVALGAIGLNFEDSSALRRA